MSLLFIICLFIAFRVCRKSFELVSLNHDFNLTCLLEIFFFFILFLCAYTVYILSKWDGIHSLHHHPLFALLIFSQILPLLWSFLSLYYLCIVLYSVREFFFIEIKEDYLFKTKIRTLVCAESILDLHSKCEIFYTLKYKY